MATTTTTQTSQQSIEPWLAAVLQKVLGEAGNVYDARSSYQAYPGARIADFTPAQQQAFALAQQGIGRFSPLYDEGAGALSQARQGLAALSYSPGSFSSNYTPQSYSSTYRPSTYSPSYSPGTFSSGYTAGQVGSPYVDTLAQKALEASRVGQAVQAGQVTTPNWDASVRDRYMDPYMQGVVDIAKREAERDFSKELQQIGGAAVKAGSFGGSRHGVVESEARRNLGQRLSDIQTKGLESGYGNAQQQFERDRAAREQADIENMRAALQAGLGSQDIFLRGAGLGLGALGQAAQVGLGGSQATEAARQQQGQLGLQAQQAGEQARQYGANLGLQGEQLRQQTGQFGANLGLQAAQQGAQERQFGSTQNLEAQRLAEASRQYGSTLGLQSMQGLAGLVPAYGQLAQSGTASSLQDVNTLLGIGGQQQGLNQQNLSLGYQDFLRQQGYPQEQLSWLNSIVRGTPYGSTTQSTTTQPAPSTTQQIAGGIFGGIGLAGLTGLFNQGGFVQKYEKGGRVLGLAGLGAGVVPSDLAALPLDDLYSLLNITSSKEDRYKDILRAIAFKEEEAPGLEASPAFSLPSYHAPGRFGSGPEPARGKGLGELLPGNVPKYSPDGYSYPGRSYPEGSKTEAFRVMGPRADGPAEVGYDFSGVAQGSPVAAEPARQAGVAQLLRGLPPADVEEKDPTSLEASFPDRAAMDKMLPASASAGAAPTKKRATAFDPWLALAMGGFGMAASKNPNFFGALGEGAQEGLKFGVLVGREQRKEEQDQRRLEVAERQAAIGERRLEEVQKGQLALARETAASRAADREREAARREEEGLRRSEERSEKQKAEYDVAFNKTREAMTRSRLIEIKNRVDNPELTVEEQREIDEKAAMSNPRSQAAKPILLDKIMRLDAEQKKLMQTNPKEAEKLTPIAKRLLDLWKL